MPQTTLQVENLIYKDVRGKELMYLKISKTIFRMRPTEETNATGQTITVNKKVPEQVQILINVGAKTYKGVEELILTPVEEPNTQQELKAKIDTNEMIKGLQQAAAEAANKK